jgi:hypothetical protein
VKQDGTRLWDAAITGYLSTGSPANRIGYANRIVVREFYDILRRLREARYNPGANLETSDGDHQLLEAYLEPLDDRFCSARNQYEDQLIDGKARIAGYLRELGLLDD